MMLALAFALTWLGLAALALAMDRHAGRLGCRRPALRPALRALGLTALAAALGCTLPCMEPAPALATWLGMLAPATLCSCKNVHIAWAVPLAGSLPVGFSRYTRTSMAISRPCSSGGAARVRVRARSSFLTAL